MSEPILILPTNLQYVDEYGVTITQLPQSEYNVYLASLLSNYTTQLGTQSSTINSLSTDVSDNYTELSASIENSEQKLLDNRLINNDTANPVEDMLAAMADEYYGLKEHLGNTADIVHVKNSFPSTLGSSAALSVTDKTLSEIDVHWINTPSTAMQSLNNLWIAFNDLRNAMLQFNVNSVNCDSLVYSIEWGEVVLSGDNTVINIKLPYLSSILDGEGVPLYEDCDTINGSPITITDDFGNVYTTYIKLVDYLKRGSIFSVTLSDTNLSPTDTFTAQINGCFRHIGTGQVCNSTSSITVNNFLSKCADISCTLLSDTLLNVVMSFPINKNVEYEIIPSYTDNGLTTTTLPSLVFTNPTTPVTRQLTTVSGRVYTFTQIITLRSNSGDTVPYTSCDPIIYTTP